MKKLFIDILIIYLYKILLAIINIMENIKEKPVYGCVNIVTKGEYTPQCGYFAQAYIQIMHSKFPTPGASDK